MSEETNATIEATKLSPEEQWFLRKTIVKLHTKGFSCSEISKTLDVKIRHVQSTVKKYKEGGLEAVSLKTMGRPRGSNTTLNPSQEEEIKQALITKTPEQYGFRGFLWDMRNVLALIMLLFCIKMPRSSMGAYFSRWGYTPQRPVIRNYKQNPAHIKEWLENTYPSIKQRAKEEKAEILWVDETGIQNCCNYVKGYAPKGQTPVAKVSTDKKLRVNMISAITNQGKLRFMMYEGKMNQIRLIEFMRCLVKRRDRKIYLILDNLPAHHGKKVGAWVEKHKEKIEIFYLPSYSPEYNPDELFNGVLKREIINRGNATTKKQFLTNVRASAMKIQRDIELVQNLFNKKEVLYAAAA